MADLKTEDETDAVDIATNNVYFRLVEDTGGGYESKRINFSSMQEAFFRDKGFPSLLNKQLYAATTDDTLTEALGNFTGVSEPLITESNKIYAITVTCVIKDSSNNAAYLEFSDVARNTAGTVTLVSVENSTNPTQRILLENSALTGLQVVFSIAGDEVYLNVIGLPATSMQWLIWYEARVL